MIKKIVMVLLIVAIAWFFVGRTINYGSVNMKRTEAELYQYRLSWLDRSR